MRPAEQAEPSTTDSEEVEEEEQREQQQLLEEEEGEAEYISPQPTLIPSTSFPVQAPSAVHKPPLSTMPATATSRTPRTPWTSQSSHGRRKGSTTTPHGIPPGRTPASVGQSSPPMLSPGSRGVVSPGRAPRAPSPNYFGLVVEGESGSPTDSHPGKHAKQNWKSSSSSIQSRAVLTPHPVPVDSNPDYEEFRKQSEAYAFNLSHGSLSRFNAPAAAASSSSSPLVTAPVLRDRSDTSSLDSRGSHGEAPSSSDAMDIDQKEESAPRPSRVLSPGQGIYDSPSQGSTISTKSASKHRAALNGELSHNDDMHSRLSLPQPMRVNQVAFSDSKSESSASENRANSLPQPLSKDGPTLLSVQDLVNLLDSVSPDDRMLLDLRVSPQFAQTRVKGALNLCIPTTLLKRPSFNVQRLADTFTSEEDKAKFARWKTVKYIVFYDANSATIKDATSSVNTLRKFTTEGWRGAAYVVRGGFFAISRSMPQLLDKDSGGGAAGGGRGSGGGSGKNLSLNSGSGLVQVAGGCPMPATKSAANPFFGNIRQNMDLIGGVGQMSIKIPEMMGARGISFLPAWLKQVVDEADKGKTAADKFLGLEKAEQQRMQAALSGDVSYGTPRPGDDASSVVQIAGIEKGTKNRYKDMLPYDHSRVRLQNVPSGECDYINASHIKAKWSSRRYIATQAPVPATFEDFWRVVWEQDVRVIVMLTAESEGGQRKCHPYWVGDKYGPLNVKPLAEKRVALKASQGLSASMKKSHLGSSLARPGVRRRATNPHGSPAAQEAAAREAASSSSAEDGETPHMIVRKLALQHTAFPFQPMREITQLQYSSWPDFGAPTHALDVLGLVEQCNAVARMYNGPSVSPSSLASRLPAKEGEHPIVVHCSAGCGRTGTFCTIDSVIDMLKRQRLARERSGYSLMQQQQQPQQQMKRQASSVKPREKIKVKARGLDGNNPDGMRMVVDSSDEPNTTTEDDTTTTDDDDHTGNDNESSSDGDDNARFKNNQASLPPPSFSDMTTNTTDAESDWLFRDDIDLVAKTVEDFRLQRLSMVQNLRQYILCYESVLEWLVKEMPERFRKDGGFRRSVGS